MIFDPFLQITKELNLAYQKYQNSSYGPLQQPRSIRCVCCIQLGQQSCYENLIELNCLEQEPFAIRGLCIQITTYESSVACIIQAIWYNSICGKALLRILCQLVINLDRKIRVLKTDSSNEVGTCFVSKKDRRKKNWSHFCHFLSHFFIPQLEKGLKLQICPFGLGNISENCFVVKRYVG